MHYNLSFKTNNISKVFFIVYLYYCFHCIYNEQLFLKTSKLFENFQFRLTFIVINFFTPDISIKNFINKSR